MSMSDPIADMLTRVRNAHSAGLEVVDVPRSKMKSEITRLLKREGYIADFAMEGDAGRTIRIYLKYDADHAPAIRQLRRESRPGRRRYVTAKDMPRVLGGMGVALVSTPQGVMTGTEAKRRNVGGELLCSVW